MLLATAAQMREADRWTIEDIGLPGIALMENAAQGAARVLMERLGPVEGRSVAALCGRGNNGGDGLAVARILANHGALATAYLMARGEDLTGDAATNLKVAQAAGVEVVEVPDQESLDRLDPIMASHDIYVDALLGTGLNSPVRGRYAEAIQLLNALEAPVVAIDIPSGLSADTGRALGMAVAADITATFGMMKLGLVLEPGDLVGELHLVDISIPPAVAQGVGVSAWLITPEAVAGWLPPRPAGSHKGDYGHVLVLGGSPGMSGAPCLAAMGAMRAGAGLVTVGLPRGLNQVAEIKLTTAMSLPLAEDGDGRLSLTAQVPALEFAAKAGAVVLGPGLGQGGEAPELARELARSVTAPLVIDADGLNALAGSPAEKGFASTAVVLTPHPGEAARLLGSSVAQVQDDRPAAARELARRWGAVAVLKGARTVVAEPGGGLWVNPTGGPLLAAGGSGDVLSGLIAGLMAQGMAPGPAARAGVYLHGLAADLAVAQYGARGLMAEELAAWLPAAFRRVESPEGAED